MSEKTQRESNIFRVMAIWNEGKNISDRDLALCVEYMRETVVMVECVEGDGIVSRSLKQILRNMEDMQHRRTA